MTTFWNEMLIRQCQSGLDMLAAAIRACPDPLWEAHLWEDPSAPPGLSAYWYLPYHTLFFTDLYLSGALEGFFPPAPFTLSELDPAGVLPDRVYTPAQLLSYYDHCKRKARKKIAGMTEDQAQRICHFSWLELPYAELVVDNIRHLQEHTAQLNLFLGQKQPGHEPHWVVKPKD